MSTCFSPHQTLHIHRHLRGLLLGLALSALACSSSTSSDSEQGTGGSEATTGGASSGGAEELSGGSSTATGGVGVGGAPGPGGPADSTSSAATGGTIGTGGLATGGVATGGQSTGGTATGGTDGNTGGVATGGSAMGGRSAGGRSSGGSGPDTGGSSTGGMATGGRATGGTSAGGADTGGTAAGGSSTGGAATGGAETGGADTGGSTGVGGQSSGYCTAGQTCRISPLGDSITEGINMPGAYRIELFRLATEAGKDITFVGTRSNGPNEQIAGKPFPKAHEGTSGISIEGLQSVVEGGALTRDDVQPNIILLHIGTNNMYGSHPAQPAELLPSLLDEIIAACPDALLVVAQIIPYNGVESYNAAIPEIVQQKAQAGAHIMMVDQYTDFPNSELADGVHPNEAGYERMARVWYDAVSEYLP